MPARPIRTSIPSFLFPLGAGPDTGERARAIAERAARIVGDEALCELSGTRGLTAPRVRLDAQQRGLGPQPRPAQLALVAVEQLQRARVLVRAERCTRAIERRDLIGQGRSSALLR